MKDPQHPVSGEIVVIGGESWKVLEVDNPALEPYWANHLRAWALPYNSYPPSFKVAIEAGSAEKGTKSYRFTVVPCRFLESEANEDGPYGP